MNTEEQIKELEQDIKERLDIEQMKRDAKRDLKAVIESADSKLHAEPSSEERYADDPKYDLLAYLGWRTAGVKTGLGVNPENYTVEALPILDHNLLAEVRAKLNFDQYMKFLAIFEAKIMPGGSDIAGRGEMGRREYAYVMFKADLQSQAEALVEAIS